MPSEAGSVGRFRRHTSRCHEVRSSFSKPKRRFMVLVCSDGVGVDCSVSLLVFFLLLDGSTYGPPGKKNLSCISQTAVRYYGEVVEKVVQYFFVYITKACQCIFLIKYIQELEAIRPITKHGNSVSNQVKLSKYTILQNTIFTFSLYCTL